MKNTLFDEKINGTVHLAIGRGFPNLGGTNVSAIHWDIVKDVRQNGRIEVNGELVQESSGMAPCLGLAVGATLSVKAIVIGCGRVGSSIARQLLAEGWEVTAVDENEDALIRLGENWPGGFVVGHGMDVDVLRAAGSRRPTPSSSRPTATTRTS